MVFPLERRLIFGQAQDEDIIRRKVLEKVATFTTWPALSRLHQEDTTEHTDSDQMLVTTSDVDSAGDAAVTAQSVEGEDDLVDVSMQDINQGDSASNQDSVRYVVVIIPPQYPDANRDKDLKESSKTSTVSAQTGSNPRCILTDSFRICSI